MDFFMAFSTKNARKDSMSLNARHWCIEASDGDKNTVIIRLFPDKNDTRIVRQLKKIDGGEFKFENGVLVAELSREATVEISELEEIQSVQLPKRLSPLILPNSLK